jgi:hypothetical protein
MQTNRKDRKEKKILNSFALLAFFAVKRLLLGFLPERFPISFGFVNVHFLFQNLGLSMLKERAKIRLFFIGHPIGSRLGTFVRGELVIV